MKLAVLGGLGMQGKAALYDLSRSTAVSHIICADANLDSWNTVTGFIDPDRVEPVRIDANSRSSLVSLLTQGVDVAIDLLPLPLMNTAFEAAIESGVPLVSTNYAHNVKHLDDPAKKEGVALMTECGLDPGIDLIIYSHLANKFDEIHVINSYCGGLPEKKACNNPLNYKVSWNWEGVLLSTRRDARAIVKGRVVEISAEQQHKNELIHRIDFPGLGSLEAIPNGDAVYFTDLLGVTANIKETGRYSLRWPGWCAFWHPLKQLGFLSDKPVNGLPCEVSSHEFLVKLLEPLLQYENDEKDLAVMVNIFEGLHKNRKIRRTSRILIERDLNTGLLAMGMGVGFPASIVAQMIADGQIKDTGILTPTVHVPSDDFLKQLKSRGIVVEEEEEVL